LDISNGHSTPLEDKVEFCVFYLRDEALIWWRWLQRQNGGHISWTEFCEEMRLQFGPDELDDPMAALANLKQTGSVQEYHKAFIKVAHLIEVSEKHVINLFLIGLKEDLRAKVKLDKPTTKVSVYRSTSARDAITLMEKKLGRFTPYKEYKATTKTTSNIERSTNSPTPGDKEL